jgi:protein SCO1
MSKRSNKKFLIGIAVAVLLPLSFYLIAKGLKKDHISMPRYYVAEKIVARTVDGRTTKDTIFHRISDLRLTNQLGESVALNTNLPGKILVVSFIYTACPSVCPKLIGNLKMLEKAFRKDPKKEVSMQNQVQLISITVDPARDSFQQMRRYADRFGVNHDHWWFLTGNRDSIYQFARQELGLSVPGAEEEGVELMHTQKIVVIDQFRYIRGYYDGLDSVAIGKCAYDISLLSMEKKRKK